MSFVELKIIYSVGYRTDVPWHTAVRHSEDYHDQVTWTWWTIDNKLWQWHKDTAKSLSFGTMLYLDMSSSVFVEGAGSNTVSYCLCVYC